MHVGRSTSRTAASLRLPVILAVIVCAGAIALPSSALGRIGTPPSAWTPPAVFPQARHLRNAGPGSLLVASRGLRDPNFFQTVVMLVDHNEEGTAGLVVNRRTDVPLSRVLKGLARPQDESATLYLGGPVSTDAVQALVRSPSAVAQGRHVAVGIHVLGTRRGLEERLASTTDSSRPRVYLGYAGWAPGQLAHEVDAGAWYVFPADADVVFDSDPDTLWSRQIKRTESLLAGMKRLAHEPSAEGD